MAGGKKTKISRKKEKSGRKSPMHAKKRCLSLFISNAATESTFAVVYKPDI